MSPPDVDFSQIYLFKFDKEQPIMYQSKFTDQQWKKIIEAFPENVSLTKVTCLSQDEQTYKINKRKSKKDAKCASCKKELTEGDIQASTEGPYGTITKSWIKRQVTLVNETFSGNASIIFFHC